jgi:trigger factor
MQVSIKNAGGLSRRMTVRIPADRVEKAVEDKVRRAGRHAKVPGFRPGKVPYKVLYQRYAESARAEVAGDLVQSTYPEALEQEGLKPAGRPQLELGEQSPEQGLAYTASFDVYPEIELKGLDKIKVEKPAAEIAETDIDKTLERLREQNREYAEVERASVDGDRAVIDFLGRVDGEAFEGGSGEDIEVTLGEGRFLPDLERALVGRKPGEHFRVDVAFPEDYGAEELAGKTADFEVAVKSVAEPRLPEIDTAFLQRMGVEEAGGAALREKVADSLRREVESAVERRVKSQVLDGLLKANPIDVPTGLVDEEIERMRGEALARLPEQMRQNPAQVEQLLPDDSLREGAQRRVAMGLLIAEVIAVKGIELDRERVDAKLDELVSGYDQTDAVKNYYRNNPQMMQGIEAMVMEDQVVEALLADARVKERKTDVDELLGGNE